MPVTPACEQPPRHTSPARRSSAVWSGGCSRGDSPGRPELSAVGRCNHEATAVFPPQTVRDGALMQLGLPQSTQWIIPFDAAGSPTAGSAASRLCPATGSRSPGSVHSPPCAPRSCSCGFPAAGGRCSGGGSSALLRRAKCPLPAGHGRHATKPLPAAAAAPTALVPHRHGASAPTPPPAAPRSPPGPSPQPEAGLPFPGSPLPGCRVFIQSPGSRQRNKLRSEQRPGLMETAQLWLLKEQLASKRRLSPVKDMHLSFVCRLKIMRLAPPHKEVFTLEKKYCVPCWLEKQCECTEHEAGSQGLGYAAPPAPGQSQRVALGKLLLLPALVPSGEITSPGPW